MSRHTALASAIDILAALVAFDTTSHRSNLAIIDWIETYLTPLGFSCERFYDPSGQKANLLASIGPRDQPGYILSGHTDVVPVDGQDWSSDPFKLIEKEGKLYGRGSCDMKGFLAICLASAPAMAKLTLARPLHLAFSYDEEVGCTGVISMVEAIAGRPIKPLACIVGEPTNMEVVIGHKGGRRMTVSVHGKAAHSSLAPQGVNAVEWGARLISHIRDRAEAQQETGRIDPLYDIGHTTIHVGSFHGGTAPNIVPHEAQFVVECRAIGGDDPKAILDGFEIYARERLEPRMKAIDAQAGFTFELMVDVPMLDTDPDEEIVTFAKRLAGRNNHSKVAYGTEAGHFQKTGGIPCVVIGPGSIEQAHKPDEFIAISELDAALGFVERLMQEAGAEP
jgi:acetylornithine deacetylase